MLNKWLREPLLHFLLIGGALFLLYDLQNKDLVDNSRIFISEADIDRLISLWEKKRQRLPSQVELQGLIEQQVREEVMYREAIAMGLDQNDSIVRRRMAQKIEFISSDLAAQIEPTDAELADYLAANTDAFEIPARIDFVQVYLNTHQNERSAQDIQHMLDALTKAGSKVDFRTVGDKLMLNQQYKQQTKHDVSRLFGKDFASQLFALPVGSWQGVIPSGYGGHLVRIDSKVTSRLPKLETVRRKVADEWQAEQRRLMNEAFYKGMRSRYDIVIEKTPSKNTPETNSITNVE